MFDIITFGSATRDIVIRPRPLSVLKYSPQSKGEVCFPVGSKIDVESIEFHIGGGGTNAAATFSLQGFRTAFCGMVGNDLPGKEVFKELKKLSISTSLVFKTSDKLTNHSIIILEANSERTILAYRGASELLSKDVIPWKKLKAKWLYLAPLTGLSCKAFGDIVNFAKDNEIAIAANPGMAQLSLGNFEEIAKKIDILIVNQEEASFLTKIPFGEEQEIFKIINASYSGILVMTKGGKGVTVSYGKHIRSAKPNLDREVVDTTGAGDAFGSGFVAEFMRSNGDIEKSIQFGMANSEGNLSEIGAKTGLLKEGQKFQKVEVVKEK